MNFSWWTKKKLYFFHLCGAKKTLFPAKKNGNFSWWLKISDKKPMVCHGHFLLCHGQSCRNCHGHFSFFTGIFLAILSRATCQISRAKFGIFATGSFCKITVTFSWSITGKTENFTKKKKNTVRVPPAFGKKSTWIGWSFFKEGYLKDSVNS